MSTIGKPFSTVVLSAATTLLCAMAGAPAAVGQCDAGNPRTVQSRQTGNWNEASTWEGGVVPNNVDSKNMDTGDRWTVFIESGHEVTLANADGSPMNVVITALTIRNLDGPEQPQVPPGELFIPDGSKLEVCCDLVLDGTANTGECRPCPGATAHGGAAASLGGNTPPILRVYVPESSASASVGTAAAATQVVVDALIVRGDFKIDIDGTVCAGKAGEPNRPRMIIHGSHQNPITTAACYVMKRARVDIKKRASTCEGSPAAGTVQTFEVAGPNRGPFFGAERNDFSIGELVIHEDVNIQFVNDEDNSSGLGPEALYVDDLTVAAGAVVTFDDAVVAACQPHISAGASIPPPARGSGLLRCAIPAVSSWGLVMTGLLVLTAATLICRRSIRAFAAG